MYCVQGVVKVTNSLKAFAPCITNTLDRETRSKLGQPEQRGSGHWQIAVQQQRTAPAAPYHWLPCLASYFMDKRTVTIQSIPST